MKLQTRLEIILLIARTDSVWVFGGVQVGVTLYSIIEFLRMKIIRYISYGCCLCV